MKKFLASIFVFLIMLQPAMASGVVKLNAVIANEFNTQANTPEIIEFTTKQEAILDYDLQIPPDAVVTASVYQFQTEKRWHKSGFIICKLLTYKEDEDAQIIDINEREIYFIARKYESIKGKDAAITSVELIGGTTVSVFIPCIDILYFFTKGAIQRQKHKNWFKAGVFNAYDNSIFWFPQKGKKIDLIEGDDIQLKSIASDKADKLKVKIDRQKAKKALKDEKKLAKREAKQAKKLAKKQKNKSIKTIQPEEEDI